MLRKRSANGSAPTYDCAAESLAALATRSEDFKNHIEFMKRFGQELSDSGELVGG